MNSKRKDLQYASVFLLAVALTFLMAQARNPHHALYRCSRRQLLLRRCAVGGGE